MIIYNITIKVEWSIADEWEQWMKDIHIPEVLATGCFEKHQLVRLLEVDEADGPTYAVQYYAASPSNHNKYLQQHASTLREKIADKWGQRYVDFKTLMQLIN